MEGRLFIGCIHIAGNMWEGLPGSSAAYFFASLPLNSSDSAQHDLLWMNQKWRNDGPILPNSDPTQLNSTQHMWDEIHHFETTILTHNQKSNPSGTFVGSSAFPRDWGGVGIEKVNLILWIHMASWIITQHLISWNHNFVSNIPRKQTSKTIIFHN